MPRSWLPSSPFLKPALLFGAVVLIYNVFPDPPAVQKAEARRRELAKQRREEAKTREIEEQVDKFEQKHPGWLEGTWPGNSNEGSPKRS